MNNRERQVMHNLKRAILHLTADSSSLTKREIKAAAKQAVADYDKLLSDEADKSVAKLKRKGVTFRDEAKSKAAFMARERDRLDWNWRCANRQFAGPIPAAAADKIDAAIARVGR